MGVITEAYLNIIPSANRNKKKFTQELSLFLNFLEFFFSMGASVDSLNDIDQAQGVWLDKIGEIVDAKRIVSISDEKAFVLTDEDYRIFIKAKIAKNMWDGEIDSLQDLWFSLFGRRIAIVDNQNMTIGIYVLGTYSEAMIALIKANLIIPKPVAVGVLFYRFAGDKLFSYGLENEISGGYGSWWYTTHEDLNFGMVNSSNEYDETGLAGWNEGVWR